MRPTRDEFFCAIAIQVATRSTCWRASVGAIIVVDKHIVSMGYNGAPPGQPQCDEIGCGGGEETRHKWPPYEVTGTVFPNGCTRATHAELNAVAFAARQGIPCIEGTMFVTHATCINCARAVVAAGIRRVVYVYPYRLTEGIELLDKCNVEVVQHGGS